MRNLIAMTMLAGLAGCGSDASPKPKKVEAPKSLVAGEYEVTSEVTKLASADKSTPSTQLKMGQKDVFKACVAADGTPDPAMFVEKGDKCSVTNSYGRSGRLSVQYDCARAGKGKLYPNADGNFTADGYKAIVTVGTVFSGDGDYNLTRTINARRTGACPAAGAKTA